jgi:hypothetical protein
VSRGKLIAGLAVVAAALAGAWILSGDRQAVAGANVEAESKPRGADERAAPVAPAARPAGRASLPPLNAPVAVILPQLEARARAGDVAAACRVAMEKMRCWRVQTLNEAEVANAPPDVATRIAEDRVACADVSRAQTVDAWRYLSQAALAGNVAAMSLFARDPQLSARPPIETAEGWLVYRDYAERFLAAAIEGGDTMALFYGWFTTATGQSLEGQGVFHKDPYKALVYGFAAIPLLDYRRQAMVSRMNDTLTTGMTREEIERVRAEGDRFRERYFRGAAVTPDVHDDTYLAPADCAK